MSGPSDKAVEAAYAASPPGTQALRAVNAAHNPALGLDRSVCLRDVLDFCRSFQPGDAAHPVADAIEREFTEAA